MSVYASASPGITPGSAQPAAETPTIEPQAPKHAAVTFAEVLARVGQELKLKDPLGGQVMDQLRSLQKQVLLKETISPRELLLYQIRAADFNLRVELFSKAAESLLATTRKLQGQQ